MKPYSSAAAAIQQRAEQWVSSTSPIYARHEDGGLECIGTGVFMEHRDCAFVITASHVVRQYIDSHELLIGHVRQFPINQPYFRSQDEEVYDVAFVPLTAEQRALLDGVRFVTTADLAPIDHEPQSHYIVGYRADDNEAEEGQTEVIASWSGYAAMSAPLEAYRERNVTDPSRLLLTFDRRGLLGGDGPVDTEPEPEGLSGAGVWRQARDMKDDRLVGIVDSHTDQGRLIYASGANALLQALDDFVDGKLSTTAEITGTSGRASQSLDPPQKGHDLVPTRES
jgi:hypothetical protein